MTAMQPSRSPSRWKPLSVAESMRREMPQARLEVFDDCGHAAPLECRSRILPRVQQFLGAHPPPPGETLEIPAAR